MSRTADQAAVRDAVHAIRDLSQKVATQVGRVVVGAEAATEQLLIAVLAGGHVLLEGVPGVAKTTLSKVFARLLGCQFQRIQFTPDLLPSDVTGTSIFNRNSGQFEFRRGPIFAQVLLADEINRAPAKTQSALLEAMQEYQVTVDGETLPLEPPFFVLATQNPIEQEGVYRLPEAQLDRFLLRVEMGYPGFAPEVAMLKLHGRPPGDPEPVADAAAIRKLQDALPGIHGDDSLLEYIVKIAEATRNHAEVLLGASPRAALNLLRCSRARAALAGRHYFSHEDVQAMALPVLGHRIILRPEAEIDGGSTPRILSEILERIPVLQARS